VKISNERFSGIFQVPDIFPICVIGAGGIGADVIQTAGKMGFQEILVFDDDTVDPINIATQNHRISDVGNTKVAAIADAVKEYSGAFVDGYCRRVDAYMQFPYQQEVVISAVDSVNARKDIWNAVLLARLNEVGPKWYIDCRMAALEYQMYVIDMNNENAMSQYGFELGSIDEADIPDLPCTEKATTFLGKLAAAHVGAELMHIVNGKCVSRWLVHNIDTQFMHTRKL